MSPKTHPHAQPVNCTDHTRHPHNHTAATKETTGGGVLVVKHQLHGAGGGAQAFAADDLLALVLGVGHHRAPGVGAGLPEVYLETQTVALALELVGDQGAAFQSHHDLLLWDPEE